MASVTSKPWTGAAGNVVIEAQPCTIHGLNLNNTGAGTVITIFDNATTNAGAILWSTSLGATTGATTIRLPESLTCLNGITVNATVALGAAGAIYVS